jgi:hypothetical protein
MERVEAFLTLRTDGPGVTVYPLDGRGQRLAPLDGRFIQRRDGAHRIHLQAVGQEWTPWYEIVTTN